MKRSGLLVNTSRSQLIARHDLVEALKAGHPGRAAVNVHDDEPIIARVNREPTIARTQLTPAAA